MGYAAPMASHISVAEAAREFFEVIERVQAHGEEFVVERAGEPVCRISPVTPRRRTVRDRRDLLRTASPAEDASLPAVEEAAKDPPMPSETPRERRLTVDEFLAARVAPPTGAGGVSLEDMERAIADGALGR